MYTFTGCSGFHYDEWKERFYPSDLSKDEWLPYYAEHFNTVEINNSFYNLPEAEKLKTWHARTPGNFRFSMKGSRYVTHAKKRSEEHTSELQSRGHLVCRLLLDKNNS